MRPHLICLSLAFVAATAFAQTKDITLKAGDSAVLKLSVPKDAAVTTKGEETTIEAKNLRIYVWRLPAARTVTEVVPHAGEVIKSEFVKYTVISTETIKVAGHEAKHLKGKGEEADDNDPGTADVVIFTDGKNLFAACVHGEEQEAAKERPGLLEVLKSAKAP